MSHLYAELHAICRGRNAIQIAAAELDAADARRQTPSVASRVVADVRCRVFRARVSDGVAMSFGPMTHRVMVVIEVELDDGTVGRGESWANYPHWAWRERLVTVLEGVRPLLLGVDAGDPAAVHADLMRQLVPLGRQWGALGPVHQAISGADVALWDAAARFQGRALVDILGGARHESLLAYGSSLGPDAVVRTAEQCDRLGLHAVKVKVGFGREADLRAVRQTREVLGHDVRVFADANQAWQREEAVEMARALRDEGVEWLEEPVTGDGLADLDAVAAASGLPLATGENLYDLGIFAEYAASGSVAILQPDVTKCGGITQYLSVAAEAAEHGITVNPHLYNGSIGVAATLQVAAAVGSTQLLEWDVRDNPLRSDVDHLLQDDGYVALPTGPGLGVDVDLDQLAKFEEDARPL